jgi:hypothetical protein
LLKFFFYALLAYLLLKAVANLLQAMLAQPGAKARPSPERDGRNHGRSGKEEERKRATRLREEEDIEDATWEDL